VVSAAQAIAHTFSNIEPLQQGVPMKVHSMELMKKVYDNLDAASADLKTFHDQNPGI